MISDLKIAKRSGDLRTYYQALCTLQSKHHTPEYLLVHDEIRARISAGCRSYTELGVNQGATLAAALLAMPGTVRGYDIRLTNYAPAQALFKRFAVIAQVYFAVIEADSLKCRIDPTDLLYIDTRHERKHLARELECHQRQVRRFIVCHDTEVCSGLRLAVDEFAARNREWSVVTDCRESVGFMTLARQE